MGIFYGFQAGLTVLISDCLKWSFSKISYPIIEKTVAYLRFR